MKRLILTGESGVSLTLTDLADVVIPFSPLSLRMGAAAVSG
jgi:hypothetical protein